MKNNWMRTLVSAVLGAFAGWLYWHQWGCTNGCSITSDPLNSTLYGAFMGGLLLNSFRESPPGREEAKP